MSMISSSTASGAGLTMECGDFGPRSSENSACRALAEAEALFMRLIRRRVKSVSGLTARFRKHMCGCLERGIYARVFGLGQIIRSLWPAIVQTYLGRATRLTQVPGCRNRSISPGSATTT